MFSLRSDFPRHCARRPSSFRSFIMPPTTLNTPPEDVLLHILSFACTDGGQTGHSLVLVSKYIRTFCVNTGVDIQCMSVCGPRNMARFLRTLFARESRSRKVKALHLSYRESGRTQDALASEGEHVCYKSFIRARVV